MQVRAGAIAPALSILARSRVMRRWCAATVIVALG